MKNISLVEPIGHLNIPSRPGRDFSILESLPKLGTYSTES